MTAAGEKFIGREKELELMEALYASDKFEFLIMHGRRRIGKTYLLTYFARKHHENTVFFTADKSSEQINVHEFCEDLNRVLHAGDYLKSLNTWKDVYSFLRDREINDRLVIIIDEFTYLMYSDKAYDSKLQNAIDRILKNKNIFLILCGSEVSVIEDIIDNSTKPLYGRKTASIKLEPFTYRQARDFFPRYSEQEALETYFCLGGVPYYLTLFDDTLSLRENLIKNCFMTTGVLYGEPDTLLRMELVETYFYKNVLLAIESGASSLNDIKLKVGSDSAKVSKYLSVLMNLGFVEKEIPCGQKSKSRNTLYRICDNYFSFYFTFIYRHRDVLNGLISPEVFYEKECTKERMNDFFGHRFEGVCQEYLRERFFNGLMPFYAEDIGRWWRTNPVLKKPEEIDIVALNDKNALIGECKYTEKAFDLGELNDLTDSAQCINRENRFYYIFSRKGITDAVAEKIQGDEHYKVISIKELFE